MQRIFSRIFGPILLTGFLVATASAKSCLWKVSGDGATLYIQGSVHVLKADSYPLAPAIEEAYAASDSLVLEADMKGMSDPETQRLIMSKAMQPAGQTLESTLDPETYRMLADRFNGSGLPIAAFQQFKPWFAAMTITLTRMQGMGFDPNRGLDKYFYDKASKDGRAVIGLETVPFQIELLDKLSGGKQAAFVKHSLEELDMVESEMGRMTAAWGTGDIDTLDKLMMEGFKDCPDLYQEFVVDRNHRWTKELDALLKKPGTRMVVVGAAHLPGKEGLLNILKEKGYRLEQL